MVPLHVLLAPGVYLGSYNTLLELSFLDSCNVKVVVNCGSTSRFLEFLNSQLPVISSDVIVLNLDPGAADTDAAYKEFHARFNKVLQNYLSFFYSYNDNVKFFVNSNYENSGLAFKSPTMNGVLLKLLFNINRLRKLIRNVNPSVGVVFVSENFGQQHHSNSILYAVAMLYLMDNYDYNFDASYKYLVSILADRLYGVSELFNHNFYADVLLIDNLKKFYVENKRIKQRESGIMTRNVKLKRSLDASDNAPEATLMKRLAPSHIY